MAIFGSDNRDNQNNQAARPANTDDQSGGNIEQTSGTVQSPMPSGEYLGEVREGTDGKKYHYSDAELTHVAPDMDPSELEEKSKQNPEDAQKQIQEDAKQMKAGFYENKSA
jgi:hypothetical protein